MVVKKAMDMATSCKRVTRIAKNYPSKRRAKRGQEHYNKLFSHTEMLFSW